MPLDLEINERFKPEPRTDFETECMERLQPGEYEIYSEKLNNIVLEGKEILTRVGVSGFFHSGDLIVGLYTAKGDLVTAYCGVFLHSVTTQIAIKYILKYFKDDPTVGIREGDIFYANEALYGGVHNPDQAAVMPIFHEGELVAWAATAVHQPETGAIEPGGMPVTARTRYDEGMKLPPMKIGENYQIRNDILEMMANMVSRAPRMQVIDTKARVVDCDRIRVRIQELIKDKGIHVVVGVMRKMIEVAEEAVYKRLESWEDGTYRSVAFFDTIGTQDSLIRCFLTLKKEGGKLTFDFTGSSPENDGSFNSFAHIVRAHSAIYLFGVPFADLPTASGIFSPIDFVVPLGTYLNANWDASVANSPVSNSGTMAVIGHAMAKLLFASGQHDIATAVYGCRGSSFVVAGVNQWGVSFADILANVFNSEGGGARSDRDGIDSWGFPWGCWGKGPDVEDMENEQPHLHLFFKHLQNSMGFGKYRGGSGATIGVAVQSVPALVYQSNSKNHKVPTSLGLFGGYPPATHPGLSLKNTDYFEKAERGDGDLPSDVMELVKDRTIQGDYKVEGNIRFAEVFRRGDIFIGSSSGGSGYGDVLDRDPKDVISDLRKGMISEEVAKRLYKLVYNSSTWAVDEEATVQARNEERDARKRRGKRYEDFVAEWSKHKPSEDALSYYGAWPNAEPTRQIVRI
ncbi:hydantoinase B/oxoprolinase family protein [Paenibacillus sp.]|uniref:hydantoinase B/oxoprolinase family protein n=1 Tax=Paenibacillus sp. TaxID=58172 RepID=UPI0035689118